MKTVVINEETFEVSSVGKTKAILAKSSGETFVVGRSLLESAGVLDINEKLGEPYSKDTKASVVSVLKTKVLIKINNTTYKFVPNKLSIDDFVAEFKKKVEVSGKSGAEWAHANAKVVGAETII